MSTASGRRLVDSGVMSPRQTRILRFITAFLDLHGYSPSIREIAAAEFLHTSTVAYQIAELEAAGLITRGPDRVARSIRVVEQP